MVPSYTIQNVVSKLVEQYSDLLPEKREIVTELTKTIALSVFATAVSLLFTGISPTLSLSRCVVEIIAGVTVTTLVGVALGPILSVALTSIEKSCKMKEDRINQDIQKLQSDLEKLPFDSKSSTIEETIEEIGKQIDEKKESLEQLPEQREHFTSNQKTIYFLVKRILSALIIDKLMGKSVQPRSMAPFLISMMVGRLCSDQVWVSGLIVPISFTDGEILSSMFNRIKPDFIPSIQLEI